MSNIHIQELERRRRKREGKLAQTASRGSNISARPSQQPPQSGFDGRAPPPRPDGRPLPQWDTEVKHPDSISSARYVSGPLHEDPPAYEDHQQRPSSHPESEPEYYSGHHRPDGRARTDPTSRGGRTGMSTPRPRPARTYVEERRPDGRDRDVHTGRTPTIYEGEEEYPRRQDPRHDSMYRRGPPIISRRNCEDFYPRGGDGGRSQGEYARTGSRNCRSETEPVSRDGCAGARRATVRPQYPDTRMMRTRSDGPSGYGPRESRRRYPTGDQEKSGHGEVDRLARQLSATKLGPRPQISIGSGNITGNNINNVNRGPRTFGLNGFVYSS